MTDTIPATGGCCLCPGPYHNHGHNPWPLVPDDDDFSRCCDTCNTTKVVPARLTMITRLRTSIDDANATD